LRIPCFPYHLIFLLLFSAVVTALSQDLDPEAEYKATTIRPQNFDQEKWEEAIEGLDYAEKPQKPKKNRKIKPGSAPSIGFSSGSGKMVMQVLIIVLGVLILALVLRYFLAGPANKKIKKEEGPVINLEKIEENIHETDLQRYIRKALETQDFALAVRLYFLAILKELSLKELIRWKKDKTNRDYLYEMNLSPLYTPFQKLVNIFELVWYGKSELNENGFKTLEKRFQQLLGEIKKVKAKKILTKG